MCLLSLHKVRDIEQRGVLIGNFSVGAPSAASQLTSASPPFPLSLSDSSHARGISCHSILFPVSHPQVLSIDMDGEEEEGGVLVGYYSYKGGHEGESLLQWFRYPVSQ